MLYISSSTPRAALTLQETKIKHSLRRHLHSPRWAHGDTALRGGGHISKGTELLAVGKHSPGGLATVWECRQSPPGPGCPAAAWCSTLCRGDGNSVRSDLPPIHHRSAGSAQGALPLLPLPACCQTGPRPEDAVTGTLPRAAAPCRVAEMARKGHSGEQDTGAAPPASKMGPASWGSTKRGTQQREGMERESRRSHVCAEGQMRMQQ